MQPGHTRGAGMYWWTQIRALSRWPPLTCSKPGSFHHDTWRLYVMPQSRALPLWIRGLLSMASLEPGVAHELVQLPLCRRLRIRGWWNALRYCRGSIQMPGSTWLLAGHWWYWGRLSSLPFFVPWSFSTMPRMFWSLSSTVCWKWLKVGVGIVAPGAAFGVGSGILPPGRQRLSATCRIVYFSKSTKSSTVVIP